MLVVPVAYAFGTLMLGLVLANFLTASANRFQTELEAEPERREQAARVIRALGRSFLPLSSPFVGIAAKIDQNLMHAGRPYGGVDGRTYLAAAIVLAILIGGGVAAFFAMNAITRGVPAVPIMLRWWIGAALFVLIFLIMDVGSAAKRHSDDIEREFPFFLDLAVLVVQAGGTPRKALAKYIEAAPGTPLSREIAITAKDADATSFDAALHRMIDRIKPTSVKTILKNLVQGERSSGEAEAFYTDQAEELRYLREEMANRAAERLKTNIVLPVFLMLMAIIIAALAPTIVSIRGQGFF